MNTVATWMIPRSIASQIKVFVIGALLLAHVMLVGAVIMLRPSLVFGNPASVFIGSVTALVKVIDAEPAETRDRALRLSAVVPDSAIVSRSEFRTVAAITPPMAALLETLKSTLNDRHRVSLGAVEGQPADRLSFGIRLDDGMILSVPVRLATLGNPLAPIFWLVASIATTLIALSVWAARQLTAPLTRFARAAERFGVALDSEPLPENGPAEIRMASAMFNQMRLRIKSMIEDRTRMLAAISHDLRTPLTRLRLRVETNERFEGQDQAVADIKAMERMLHSALQYLRWEDKRFKQEAVDLPALLQTLCSDLADLGFDVSYHGPLHLAALCDPELLARAISNLVDNAIRHGSTVRVRLRAIEPDRVLIEIEDNGPGIAEREKASVFEPFARGRTNGDVHDDGGFGLGMSIVKTIVEDHGGSITLADANPHGLIAKIWLPVSVRHPAQQAAQFAVHQ